MAGHPDEFHDHFTGFWQLWPAAKIVDRAGSFGLVYLHGVRAIGFCSRLHSYG